MLRLLLPVLRDAPSSFRIHGRHPRGLNPLAAAAHVQPGAAAVLRPALRLFSTSTAASDYLIGTWGLTPEQASEAAEHLSCRSNADAVRAFLLNKLGLSKAAAASAVARKPKLLQSSVKGTLARCVADLRGLPPMKLTGDPEIRRLVAAYPELLLGRLYIRRFWTHRFQFRLTLCQVEAVLSDHPGLLDHSTDKVALNTALLRRFLRKSRPFGELGTVTDGLPGGFILRPLASELNQVFVLAPRLFTATREELEAVVARAEERGGGDTFASRVALLAGHPLCRQNAGAKVELLESLGFSARQVGGMLFSLRATFVLSWSEEKLRSTVEFLTKEVGWELDEVARCWVLFQRSVDMRLRPFFKVFSILREEGLLEEAIARCSNPSPCTELDPDTCDGAQGLKPDTCKGTQELDMLRYTFKWPTQERFEVACVRPYEGSIPALTDAFAVTRAPPRKTDSTRVWPSQAYPQRTFISTLRSVQSIRKYARNTSIR